MSQYLKTNGINIIGHNDKPIFLRGVNFGGWLMKEAYLLHAPNFPEHQFRKTFSKKLGARALKQFDQKYRDHFITEKDFKNVAKLGFNCIRLPFHYNLVESSAYIIDRAGVKILDRVISWAQKHKIYIILDLHAAPGCQNHDWHSDSAGRAQFWTKKDNQERVYKIWQYLADRYKNKKYVAGYDLLNESVVDDDQKLNSFYQTLIKKIREVDQNHILFIEGNKWATDIACLDPIEDDNYVLSIHSYEPLDFTFNFVPFLNYPSSSKKRVHNTLTTRKHLQQYADVSKKLNVPIFCGEFGVNYREAQYGEDKWLEDNLEFFREFDFHWTYWTYKAIKNNAFPDGVYSFRENPPWVHREGPLMGWDTYHLHWKKYKRAMIKSWNTDQFKENKSVLDLLRKYA